ncbi:MAG: MATE family efflux transporter [Tissierellia bacterium]|nr:MATE family efflux transporter [Tissierellia bacterium]
MERAEGNNNFYKEMIGIALPITLQNLIANSVNMLDTLMISSLGAQSLAAVGFANQVFFLYAVTIFGIATGSSIFVAQFWGKKDKNNIRRIIGISLVLSGLLGLIFTLAVIIFPESIMRIFSKDPEVIKLGMDYLAIIVFTYIITGISFTFSIASRSIGQAKMPMIVSIVSFVTNGIFNYLLIFGKFGFPKLGVRGAAYGTLIARVIELALVLYAIYSDRENPLAGSIGDMTDWNRDFFKRYLNTTYPVIINEALWSLGNVMYSIAYAKIGTNAAASVQILNVIYNLFMVLARGMANACTVMVGNKIGAEEEDIAIDYANRFLKLSTLIGGIMGFTLYIFSDNILGIFKNLEPEVYVMSKDLLIVLSIFFFIKAMNSTLIVGVLRGGGDTKFSMKLEMAAVWLVGVPLAFLGAVYLKLPVHLVVTLVYAEEVIKAAIGIPRVMSKKWVKNVIRDMT